MNPLKVQQTMQMRTDYPIQSLICITMLGSSMLVGPASLAGTSQSQAWTPSALSTRNQLQAEKETLHLLTDPAVKAEIAKARRALLSDPAAQTNDGRARLDHALQEWVASLILRETGNDAEHPEILWVVDNTPHTWFGQTIPGTGVAGDNPDHIYRGAVLDGGLRYEVDGKISPHTPAQFSFELTPGTPGHPALKAQTPGHGDMGGQLGLLTNRDIQVKPDGSFSITIDSDAADGRPNHLHSEAGPLSLTIRDVLSDWQQRPNPLSIRLVGSPPTRPPLNEAQVRALVLADLTDYVEFWSSFKNKWLGGNLQANQIVTPFPRDGGWGYLAAGRYDLAADQVLLITTERRGADYTGVQITDPWMIAPDARSHSTSVNTAKAKANADGSVTYAIAPTDPGLANWVDTAGLHQGYVLLRWQGFPANAKPEGLLKSFRVVTYADLQADEFKDLPRSGPVQRQAQLAQRALEYTYRLRD
jgi:hypothetical protein